MKLTIRFQESLTKSSSEAKRYVELKTTRLEQNAIMGHVRIYVTKWDNPDLHKKQTIAFATISPISLSKIPYSHKK